MWKYNYHLGFTEPTVKQDRNQQDLKKDFENETLLYLHIEEILDIIRKVPSFNSPQKHLINIYSALAKKSFVKKQEVTSVKKWVFDLEKLIE